ncbi:MAG TPA: sulfatase-like hydrolase/transferase, partial [Spirochaetia bacterium]|nr:sulfatase-like hydrolase/transferase [Spirochaetia bacterium]
MKAILILADSLNRRFLPVYGNNWVKAPNIGRLARKSVVFDNHWAGSMPCMPARRDMLTGRLNFLEREWGGVEPFDVPFVRLLRQAGVYTRMETDHYHYFHVGGENYHTLFNSWRFHRGQEWDLCEGS